MAICGVTAFAGLVSSQHTNAQSIRRTPIVSIVEEVAPAVVNISAEAIVRAPDPFFGDFFAQRRRVLIFGSRSRRYAFRTEPAAAAGTIGRDA